MTGLVLALQLLTRIPLPAVAVDEAGFARGIRWFPAAGLVVGGLLAAAGAVAATVDPILAAWAVLLLWVGVTGALHLDGLADIVDAAGAAHGDSAKLHAVLRDPHVGSFGVVAIGLQLITKIVLSWLLFARGLEGALPIIPAVARIGPLCWTRWLPPLHAGLASRFRTGFGLRHILLWAGVSLPALWLFPALAVAPLLIALWGMYLKRRIGGISGDGHGAGIELVESGLLLSVLLQPQFS